MQCIRVCVKPCLECITLMYESDLFVNVLYTRCKYNVQALVFRLHYGLDCFVVVVFPTSLQCPT